MLQSETSCTSCQMTLQERVDALPDRLLAADTGPVRCILPVIAKQHKCPHSLSSSLACNIWTAKSGRSSAPSPRCVRIWWQAQ